MAVSVAEGVDPNDAMMRGRDRVQDAIEAFDARVDLIHPDKERGKRGRRRRLMSTHPHVLLPQGSRLDDPAVIGGAVGSVESAVSGCRRIVPVHRVAWRCIQASIMGARFAAPPGARLA